MTAESRILCHRIEPAKEPCSGQKLQRVSDGVRYNSAPHKGAFRVSDGVYIAVHTGKLRHF